MDAYDLHMWMLECFLEGVNAELDSEQCGRTAQELVTVNTQCNRQSVQQLVVEQRNKITNAETCCGDEQRDKHCGSIPDSSTRRQWPTTLC